MNMISGGQDWSWAGREPDKFAALKDADWEVLEFYKISDE